MVAIAAAVLVTFIGGLYFITHHKKEESETLQNQKVTGNGIPPKPEERWRYIKELKAVSPRTCAYRTVRRRRGAERRPINQ